MPVKKVRWRFRKILWPSQKIWTLHKFIKYSLHYFMCEDHHILVKLEELNMLSIWPCRMQPSTYLLQCFFSNLFGHFLTKELPKSKSTYPSFFMLWILVLLRWRREEEEGESFVYPIFFFATPPISQRHSDPRHARELVSNPAITTNCHWQKIIIRLSSSQVRASTLVELQALQYFSSHSGSLDYI